MTKHKSTRHGWWAAGAPGCTHLDDHAACRPGGAQEQGLLVSHACKHRQETKVAHARH